MDGAYVNKVNVASQCSHLEVLLLSKFWSGRRGVNFYWYWSPSFHAVVVLVLIFFSFIPNTFSHAVWHMLAWHIYCKLSQRTVHEMFCDSILRFKILQTAWKKCQMLSFQSFTNRSSLNLSILFGLIRDLKCECKIANNLIDGSITE